MGRWEILEEALEQAQAERMNLLAEENRKRDARNEGRRECYRFRKWFPRPKRPRRPNGEGVIFIGPARRRHLKIEVEAAVLGEIVLRKNDIAVEGFRAVLEAMAKNPEEEVFCALRRGEQDVVDRLVRDAVAGWLARYAVPDPRPSGPILWVEEDIRGILAVMRDLAAKGFEALPKKPQALAELRAHDQALAELGVLERFLTSSHLVSRKRFLRASFAIREERGAPQNCYSPQCYEEAWRDHVDRLRRDLAGRYRDLDQ